MGFPPVKNHADNFRMSTENTIPTFEPHEVSAEVLNRITQILHSTELTSTTFTRPLPNGEGELAEAVIGKMHGTENPHTVVSTFGLGGTETKGSITVDADEQQKQLNFHSELFMVADSLKTAQKYAEELARLAYFVVDTQQPLMPGSIVGYEQDGEKKIYFFTEKSLGALKDHGAAPVLSEDFAVCFVAATKLYPTEAELIQQEKLSLEDFDAFLVGLGIEAYSPTRPEYSK